MSIKTAIVGHQIASLIKEARQRTGNCETSVTINGIPIEDCTFARFDVRDTIVVTMSSNEIQAKPKNTKQKPYYRKGRWE